MKIHTADSLEKLEDLEANSVHAVITDPPYGLAFMGRDWDDFEPKEYQEWCEKWATKAKRVLKPGGHLLAFSGNRTHHRLFTGVEDAGFEIRDTLTFHYGSGFPKASDISKTIDKRADAEREVVGENPNKRETDSDKFNSENRVVDHTAPATDAAKKWDGWKTGLKPATEFVVMARKPFSGATVDSVLENGTGALNIDGCRIDTDDDLHGGATTDTPRKSDLSGDNRSDSGKGMFASGSNPNLEPSEGRYPSNVIFDEVAAEQLDEEVGELGGGEFRTNKEVDKGDRSDIDGFERKGGQIIEDDAPDMIRQFGDSGGPSRYFYTSKASKAERTENGSIDNSHPTVKPVDLMEWLVTLVTKEEQIVLDPFCGSGTTGKACKAKNREFIGIEKQPKWADVARVRCGLTPEDPSVVREDNSQQGLEQF